MRIFLKIAAIFIFLNLNLSCSEKEPEFKKSRFKNVKITKKESPAVIISKPELIRTFPHNTGHFTQGLLIHNGIMYESTGQRGFSKLLKIDLQSGNTLQEKSLDDKYFGEGIAVYDEKIYFLTWTSQICFVYDAETLVETNSLTYYTQGWGLTSDGTYLIMSDGSSFIRFVDPEDFTIIKSIRVKMNGKPVEYLNELEYANGLIYANVWMKDHIVAFDPETGIVSKKINMSELRKNEANNPKAEVLNGIAYNRSTGNFIVTGKNWENYYEVKFK